LNLRHRHAHGIDILNDLRNRNEQNRIGC
jgi:hypothetical protein